MADTFFGASLTLGTTAESFQILEGSYDGASIEMYDTSHTGTTGGYRTKSPVDLLEGGEFTLSVIFDPDIDETGFVGTQQTITITYPVPSGLTNGATRVFSGTVSNYSNEYPLDDKMTAELTISVDGAVTVTAAS